MSATRYLRKCLIGLLVVSGVAAASLWHVAPAAAAGETYTWKDYRTITITGGNTIQDTALMAKYPNLNRSTLVVDQGDPSLVGDQIGKFFGTAYVNMGGHKCEFGFSIYIYKGNAQGMVWAPPPYDNAPPGTTAPDYPPDCRQFPDIYNQLEASFHDHYVAIGGTRPTDPNGPPERPEEQTFQVIVNAPDPQTTAPTTDTVYVYTADGKTQVTSATGPFQIASQGWPPAQTPVAALITIQGLLPGNYIVCDTYVAKNCTDPTKLIPGQKITKVKYSSTGSTTLGTLYQTPDQLRINGQINWVTVAPCNSSVNVDPITVTLTGPDKKVYTEKSTPGAIAGANPPQSTDCMRNVSLGMQVVFNNMKPGIYTACTALGGCVKVTKVDGQAASFTITINAGPQEPGDQPVCTSGDGIAGALAWIICPVVEIVAKATDFFETHIIIPFMTVSPLTTSATNPIYILWGDFRDLANVGFVVVLFISIFSVALSKYGIKRMAPRLVLVIVGINLSYFIFAIAIDASNILGGGASALITAALKQAGTTQLTNATTATPVQSIFVLGGAALASILLTGGSALGWLFGFIGLAGLVVVAVVIVLVLRQIAIICLAIIAPVAILADLLPNTQQYTTKFRRTSVKLLVMYPLMVLLFAAGKIFNVVLQQPDFHIGGTGVTNGVGQAVRVGLQFVANVAPLALMPVVFAASGAAVDRAYGWFHRRAVKPVAKQLSANIGQEAKRVGTEARQRLTNAPLGIGWVAGRSINRQAIQEAREANLKRQQEAYVAESMATSGWLRRRAAGVAGQAGQTRAEAGAATTAEHGRAEDLKAEQSLLTQEMRQLGMDEETFAEHVAAYLENPTLPANRVVTGANGRTFNFAANAPRLQRAMIDSAASQGYIRAVEAARLSPDTDQRTVDDIIRKNDSVLKQKGGYHLATNFGLAAGRMEVHDPATGALRAPANPFEMEAEMRAQRLVAMAQTGANSIAGMKVSAVVDAADMLRTPSPMLTQVQQTITHLNAAATASTGSPVDYRDLMRQKLDIILDPTRPETLNNSDISRQDFEDIRTHI